MQKHPDRANQPMLPFVRGDHGNAVDFVLMGFHEGGVFLESRKIFPAAQLGGVNQKPEAPLLPDKWFDLPSQFSEIARLQFYRRDDLQDAAGDQFCSYHRFLPLPAHDLQITRRVALGTEMPVALRS